MSRVQISPLGFSSLLSLVVEATPNALGIAPVYQLAHEDAWLSPPISMALVLVLIFPLFRLFSTLGETMYADDDLPLPLWARLLLLPLLAVLLCWLMFNARVYSDVICLAYLPMTPEWVIYAGFFAICAFASFHGLEVLARVGLFVVIVKVAVISFCPVLVVPEADFKNLLPFFAHGPLPVLRSLVPVTGWFLEGAVLALVYPLVTQIRFRAVFAGFGLTTLSFYNQFLLSVLVFTASLTARMTYPALDLVQIMAVGEFFERIDPILVMVWSFAMLVKSSVYLWLLSTLSARLFHVKIRKRLSWLIALFALFGARNIVRDVPESIYFYRNWWVWLSLCALVSLYLFAAVLHAKKSHGETTEETWNSNGLEGRMQDGST